MVDSVEARISASAYLGIDVGFHAPVWCLSICKFYYPAGLIVLI
ncbi:hypothetical protein BN2497_12597 [Janthinobacterium sp. CG23_2]|nr:hypothetical protein BN2497_12597 [Janthinobacterium sp. CG23_2]CUU32696.1 hypothetical protein BN3177_12597 [Janthinobacterium sp. CG23_2]